MFIRKKKTKTADVLQLVQSYRNGEGQPRQRIVLSLGSIDIAPAIWGQVADELENRMKGIKTLFESPQEVRQWAEIILNRLEQENKLSCNDQMPEKITVSPDDITTENHRELGPCLVAKKAWDSLGLDEILSGLGFSPSQCTDAAITVINRLCEAVSEYALPGWINTTALSELFGQSLDNLESSRFYRISDKLGLSKNAIEEALARHECDIFNIKHTIFLYDLTNTYFEGSALNNEIAQRGHSKEKRFDCPLVSCGMILNQDGFIVKHQSFAGNIGEAKTLKEQIQSLEEDYKGSLIVIDSGIASVENLQIIKDMGFDYITVAKRPSRLAYEEQFADLDKFRKIQGREDKSEVLINAFEKDGEKLVACISSQREQKERAILSLAEQRLLKDLQGLCGSIDKGTLKVEEKINRRIGRLLERHSRVARYYEIAYNKDKNALEYSRKQEYEHASMLCGGYVLRCSRKDMDDADIWRIYIMLTKVESGFKALKSDLGLRPIYHQKASRTSDHIFISILAYHLLHWIEYKLQTEGMNISWRALKRLLQTHGYATIVADAEQGLCRIRKAGRAEPKQQEIYEKLGIEFNSLPTIKSFTAK